MNKIKILLSTAAVWLLLFVNAYGAPRDGYTQIYYTYEKSGLAITSFSEKWQGEKIEALYNELLQNFHGSEFAYLRDIYLYPDSPDGTAGRHSSQTISPRNGALEFGYASIDLYNMDNISDIEGVAVTLSHEYGHHYTLYNMTRYENLPYINWRDSEYAALRSLREHTISYSLSDAAYNYINDITEIAANDYVQLLGSPTAKKSYDYQDSEEVLALGEDIFMPIGFFNCMPQYSMELPLAADVNGLFDYFIKISSRAKEAVEAPVITTHPAILAIQKEPSYMHYKYTLRFSKAEGNGPFEYTVVMYRPDEAYNPIPVKTLSDEDVPQAVFGSVYRNEPDGSINGVFEAYDGIYAFRVFSKDRNGFIYSSQIFLCDFGDEKGSVQ